MSALIAISGLMFVFGLYGMIRTWNGGPYPAEGGQIASIYIAGYFLIWFVSVVLFGVVLGMWIGGTRL